MVNTQVSTYDGFGDEEGFKNAIKERERKKLEKVLGLYVFVYMYTV